MDHLFSLSGAAENAPHFPSEELKTAVILAEGRQKDLSGCAGLELLSDGDTVLDRLMRNLENGGIKKFVIVAGFEFERFRERFGSRQDVVLIENPRWKWTGSMASLALAAPHLDEGFLVVKGDLVLEQRAIDALVSDQNHFAAVLSRPTGGENDLFVELDEQGGIFRMSRDIHQVNRVQGVSVGLCKVPLSVLEQMMEYFSRNQNPLINFEYVLESVGRLYRFYGVEVDDLVWGRVRDRESFAEVTDRIHPRILRKEKEMREQLAAEAVTDILGIEEKDISRISFAGGLTNLNYYVEAAGERYILRLPGRMTESMISRENEKHNAELASSAGFNSELVFCNAETGVKLSRYIDGAETLGPLTVRLDGNMKKTADILSRLHRSALPQQNRFDPFREAEKYESLLDDPSGRMYKGYDAMRLKVNTLLRARLDELGYEQCPCHNDLVAANLVLSRAGRLYLIDWEYAGLNDPMFDVAALFLENDFTPEDEELFFHYYFGGEKEPAHCREKILIFKIVQDFLWSIWTVLKESKGDDFGSYGPDRFARAKRNMAVWEDML
ncbi:MAG: phosphotransferase [Oscillospiraceae bacterium]|nr:phosphotransferase [Oscillospiraceae bacterium]